MNYLSLFSGIGGFDLGCLLQDWRCVGFVEINKFCCEILEQRMKDGVFKKTPIWNLDIGEFNRKVAPIYEGMVDGVVASPPCQPFSVAGKRKGKDDSRNLWPQTIDTVRLVRPQFVLCENVPGLLTSGYFDAILGDLAASGYDAKWCCLSARKIGANHKRSRLWILATDSNREWKQQSQGMQQKQRGRIVDSCKEISDSNGRGCQTGSDAVRRETRAEPARRTEGTGMANPIGTGLEKRESQPENNGKEFKTAERSGTAEIQRYSWWDIEPGICPLVNGYAGRVDEIKALGNAVVPAMVPNVWRLLNEE